MRLAFLIALFSIGISGVYAQTGSVPQTATTDALPCNAFQHNMDGSWTPLVPLTVTSSNGTTIQVSPNMMPFRAGVLMVGIDFGALLDQQCGAH
jgi:hypothetical protein